MKIYRTLTLPRVLTCAVFTAVFSAMMVFNSGSDVTEDTIRTFAVLFLILGFTFFYSCFGDSHYLYFASESPGYKYFRSIPYAKKHFKSLCIKHDIIFFALGLILFIPVILSGFKKSLFVIGFLAYMISYAFNHIVSVIAKSGMGTYVLLKAFSGGGIGMLVIIFAVSVGETTVLGKMAASTGIIISVIAFILGAVGLICFYLNFEKKWNAD